MAGILVLLLKNIQGGGLLKHRIRKSALVITTQVSNTIKLLLQDEAISGKILLGAAIIAIITANSPLRDIYDAFWLRHFSIAFGGTGVSETLKHWINEGLMALFFLVISLEIKREIVWGELRHWRVAALPVAAAIGGALVPIGLYMLVNHGHAGAHGWGVPMTTDTAFCIGLLALLGKRVPLPLKLFLLTATVVDDVGAITAIAVFYNHAVHIVPLLWGMGVLATILILHWIRLLRLTTFVALGVVLWLAIHASGVPASITGVILGLSAPLMTRRKTKGAIANRLERALIPVSTLLVVPLFAFANAGVSISRDTFTTNDAALTGVGVAMGLVAGKALGIFTGAWIVVKMRLSSLPAGIRWGHIGGVGFLSGVGFTLSIFIAELAFEEQPILLRAAKVSVFAASLVSAVIGLIVVRISCRRSEPITPDED